MTNSIFPLRFGRRARPSFSGGAAPGGCWRRWSSSSGWRRSHHLFDRPASRWLDGPESTSPEGAQALVTLLRDQGVDVSRRETSPRSNARHGPTPSSRCADLPSRRRCAAKIYALPGDRLLWSRYRRPVKHWHPKSALPIRHRSAAPNPTATFGRRRAPEPAVPRERRVQSGRRRPGHAVTIGALVRYSTAIATSPSSAPPVS